MAIAVRKTKLTSNPTRAQQRAERLEALRKEAQAAGNFGVVFPTAAQPFEAPFTQAAAPVSVTLPPLSPTVASYTLTPDAEEPSEELTEPLQQGRLASLAHEINVRLQKFDKLDSQANDHRLAAALCLAEARKICTERKINFRFWTEEHIPHAYETVYALVRVGNSPDPRLALEDLRKGNAERNKRLRERKAEGAPMLRAPKVPRAKVAPVAVDVTAASDQAAASDTHRSAPSDLMPLSPADKAEARADLFTLLPLLDAAERRELADKATLALSDAAARAHVEYVVNKLELGTHGSNYFATVGSMLVDFQSLTESDKAEFLRAAAEQVGAIVEMIA